MLKENSILPMGACETATEYDYTDGLTLVISEFTDGSTAEIEIPDTKGNTVMRVMAVCRDGEITIETEGGKGKVEIENLGGQRVTVKE